MRASTEGLARAASRHPWRTIGAWVAAMAAAAAATGLLLGDSLTSDQRLTNDPESYRAGDLIHERLPAPPDFEDVAVVRSETATVADARFRAFVETLVSRLRSLPDVESVAWYGESDDPSLVSRDRHATLLPLTFGADGATAIGGVVDVVKAADGVEGFDTAITGAWTIDRDFLTLSQSDLKQGEAYFGAPAALVVLLLVFGALVAAGLPLVLALVSILVALGLTALVAAVFELSIFVVNMLTAVGLALGVDYTLFVLSRYREERAGGRDRDEAIAAAGATASRAVLVSGSAFVIALLGLLLVPDNIMRSLAVGAILVGAVSVVAALTLLPAVLRLVGDGVDRLRLPYAGRLAATGGTEGRFWARAARAVMARPVVSLVAVVVVLLAAASPVLGLKTGFASVSTFPDGFVSKEGLQALDRDFRGGVSDPVQVVVDGDTRNAAVRAAIGRLRERLARDERFGPVAVTYAPAGDLALLTSALPGGATDPEPVAAVRTLRSEYVPDAFRGVDARVLVGGETARDVDYFDTMDRWLPIVFAFVLGLSFLLLTTFFRSVVVAVKAIVLNLLSVGAAYGLLVLVFQEGVGAGLLGFTQVDSVVAWVPLFLFCILFGLSMDYHVFLLSRIRERFVATDDNAESVAYGIRTTARLITGAALIIIVVFVGFATGDLVMFQQMGFGVAVALLLDATIVRTVLVPAAMQLLGERNWYLPSWLEWLPDVHVEGERSS